MAGMTTRTMPIDEELTHRGKDYLLLRRLSEYIRPHLPLLLGAAFFLLLALVLDLYRPLLLKNTIDRAIPAQNHGLVLQYAALYMGSIIINIVALFIQNYLLASFGQKIIYEIRNSVFMKLIVRSPEHFSSVPVGNLVTRVTSDTEALRSLYTDVVLKLVSSSLMILGILFSMYLLDKKLAMVVTFLVPLMGAVIFVYQKFARRAFRGVRTKLAASNASVQEVLNFIIIIKAYVGEKMIARQYDRISREFLAAGLFEVKTFAIFRPIVDFLFFAAIIAILSFTNWFDHLAEAGTVFAFLQYMNKFFEPLKDIADKYNMLQSSMAGAERLVPVLNEAEEVPLQEEHIPPELWPVQKIVFDHVWFAYQGSKEWAVRDISFTIEAGQFIGIAGPSGGGKSTLMSLLMAFARPSKGSILINGQDSLNYSPRIIRELMGYVFQDSHLFKGTIRENMALYEEHTPEAALVEAAEKASLHEMIMRLPQGYDTPVGYLGSLLSSGQKQLLALARVLVKNKSILIFDEATANIDSDTEQRIQRSIEAIRGEKTIISIAHRLSTIRSADMILLIEKGAIAERGSFDQLVAKKGQFYSLWSNQFEQAEPESEQVEPEFEQAKSDRKG